MPSLLTGESKLHSDSSVAQYEGAGERASEKLSNRKLQGSKDPGHHRAYSAVSIEITWHIMTCCINHCSLLTLFLGGSSEFLGRRNESTSGEFGRHLSSGTPRVADPAHDQLWRGLMNQEQKWAVAHSITVIQLLCQEYFFSWPTEKGG
jgi:hypothetical protein